MNRQKVICIDLDGTILTYKPGWFSLNVYGKLIEGADVFLRRLKEDGWHIIIYTVRKDRVRIEKILSGFGVIKGVHYDAINKRKNVQPGSYKGKIGADLYLDDRAVNFNGSWSESYYKIKHFMDWKKDAE